MNIRFGKLKVTTPKVEKVEVEKYDYPVLTMYPAPTEPKGRYRFELNKAALTMLQLSGTEGLHFGFTDNEGNLLSNIVMAKFTEGNKVNALGNFFNKQLFDDIHTFLGTKQNHEMVFSIKYNPSNGYYDLFKLDIQQENCIEGDMEVACTDCGSDYDLDITTVPAVEKSSFFSGYTRPNPDAGMEPNPEFQQNRF